MNNTIPFHSAPHAPQITVDVNILSMLKQAASCLSKMASENVYLAAIGPDMELTIIVEEDAPSVLPCFDEDDALISVKGAPLFISYIYRFQTYLESHSTTLMADDQKLTCICID